MREILRRHQTKATQPYDVKGLLGEIDKYLYRKNQPRVDPGWFHPSGLSNPCDAALAFEFLGLARPSPDPKVLRIFDMGHDRDMAWKGYMREAGFSIAHQREGGLKIRIPEYRIRGEFDDLINYKGKLYIVDYKTCNDKIFQGLEDAMDSHKTQVHAYMAGVEVYDALVLYENKNNCETKVFHVPWDQARWKGITDRLVRIMSDLRMGNAIERDPKGGCTYPGDCAMFDFRQGPEQLKQVLGW